MKTKYKIVMIMTTVILLFDQWTKVLILKTLPLGSKMVVWDHFFDLVHTRNKGAAFGILSDWISDYRDVFFYVLGGIAIFFLLHFLKTISNSRPWASLPVALVLGGALGNIFDRIFRGSVVDFLSLHWYDHEVDFSLFGYSLGFDLIWPAFNVADSAITVGVFWLVYEMSRQK